MSLLGCLYSLPRNLHTLLFITFFFYMPWLVICSWRSIDYIQWFSVFVYREEFFCSFYTSENMNIIETTFFSFSKVTLFNFCLNLRCTTSYFFTNSAHGSRTSFSSLAGSCILLNWSRNVYSPKHTFNPRVS